MHFDLKARFILCLYIAEKYGQPELSDHFLSIYIGQQIINACFWKKESQFRFSSKDHDSTKLLSYKYMNIVHYLPHHFCPEDTFPAHFLDSGELS